MRNRPDLPKITKQLLTENFSPSTLVRAHGIVHDELIELCSEGPNPDEIMGVVWGTAPDPYLTKITVTTRSAVSLCTCPVGMQCKHAAATLIRFQTMQTSSDTTRVEGFSVTDLQETQPSASDLNEVINRWANDLVTAATPRSTANTTSIDASTDYNAAVFRWRLGQDHDELWGIEALKSRWTRGGLLAKGKRYSLTHHYDYDEYSYHNDDRLILDLLKIQLRAETTISRRTQDKFHARLFGATGAHITDQLLNTKRLFHFNDDIKPLSRGPTVNATLSWRSVTGEDAGPLAQKNAGPLSQERFKSKRYKCIKVELDGIQSSTFLPTDPPYYIDEFNHQLGRIITPLDAKSFHLLAHAPPIPEDDAQAIANHLSIHLPTFELPLPAEPNVEFVNTPPVRIILVHSSNDSVDIDTWQVTLQVRYGELVLSPLSDVRQVKSIYTGDTGQVFKVDRDLPFEMALLEDWQQVQQGFVERLSDSYLRQPMEYVPRDTSLYGKFETFNSLLVEQATLEALGFELIVKAPVSVNYETASQFNISLDDGGNGWFDLSLSFKHGQHQYQLLPLVTQWLERGDSNTPLVFQGKDGQWIELPLSVLLPVAETLLELNDDSADANQVRLQRSRALSLDKLQEELDEADVDTDWSDAAGILELGEKLRAMAENKTHNFDKAKAPRSLKAELRPYQLYGMAWLDYLERAGLNGILADDMGLGKTIQTLAHILSLRQRRRLGGTVLVVVPTSLLGNWAQEAARFAPSLSVRIWHGGDRHVTPLSSEKANLIITSYSLALRDQSLLAEHNFSYLVLDEAQNIKNPLAKVTRALKALPIERRLCLTGTPIENHLGELWSQFDFLMSGMLGSKNRFTRHFRTPIEKHGIQSRQQRLNAAVQPFMLRRRKENVAAELPVKTEIIQKISLEPAQAKLYESIRLSMEKRVRKLLRERGVARSQIQVLDALLKLRQTCCHPSLIKLPSARNINKSAKTTHALSMIQELIAEGRKIILFSQFTEMLGLLETELKSLGIDYVKLTGQTRKRTQVIDAYQKGDVPLFLISLKAGGTGLNLTAADTVIHYDPWWNPAVERQATDRAHRIGQNKPVFVYKLIIKDSVEEKILAMQQRKQSLSDATVEQKDSGTVKNMNAEDILNLFSGN